MNGKNTRARRTLTLRCLIVALCATAPLDAATQQVGEDDEDARRRLIRKTAGQDDGNIMTAIIDTMSQVEERLAIDLDAGASTLDAQDRILRDIDRAIEEARKNLQSKNRQPQSQGENQPPGEPDDARDSADQQQGAQQSGAGRRGDGTEQSGDPQGALFEARRQWGNLPPRQRQEIMQGINEDFDEEFREHINRYYEALSREADEQ